MRAYSIGLGVLLLGACQASSNNDTAPSAVELVRAPGTTIAEGRNRAPSGPFGLVSYRIEEVRLRGSSNTRLTVTGGPFTPGDMPWIVWINGSRAGSAGESGDLAGLVLLLDSRNTLRRGAQLEISRGDSGERFPLPEALDVP